MKQDFQNVPGLFLANREFELPLDHSRPSGQKIRVFVREVIAPGKEKLDLPCVVFFQGGGGCFAAGPGPFHQY